MKKRIREQVDLVGNWHPHLLEYTKVKRPDSFDNLEALLNINSRAKLDNDVGDALKLIAALAYAAGRSSVVAELEKTTITELEKSR